jgi:hypothetical protein
MVQVSGDALIVARWIGETEILGYRDGDEPEEVAHGEQGLPSVVIISIRIGAQQQLP